MTYTLAFEDIINRSNQLAKN